MFVRNYRTLKLHKKTAQKLMVYVLVFLSALHITPAGYFNSLFLSQFIGSEYVGYIYAAGSVMAVILFAYIKVVLNHIGNYKTFMRSLWVDFGSMLILSSSLLVPDPISYGPLWISAFIVGYVARMITVFNTDIFLEHYSDNRDTGKIRGFYLTSINLAFVMGPFISSLLITDVTNAAKVYVWGAVVLIPIMLIARFHFNKFDDREYKRTKLVKTIRKVLAHPDLSKVCACDFLLRFFYSWMVIYAPIFLSQIGFTLAEIGTIISFALLPFVLFQLPAGRIADKILGEKELLTAGFIIMGLFTISMSLFDQRIFWLWAGIMFVTRIGASMVEIMNETYLFKKINDSDVDILSLYRSISPFTYLISPILASILLIHFEINHLFVFLGCLVLLGTVFSSRLRDTL